MGFFDALSRGLERSREALNEVFYFGGEVDEDFWEDLEDTLVMGDMGAEVAIKVSDDLRDAAAKKNLKTAPQLRRALAEQLEQHFVPAERDPFADTPSCVLFVGINGAGKTTTLRLLAHIEEPDTGSVEYGHGCKIGYFAQEHDTLDLNATVLENLQHVAPELDNTQARSILGSFLFSGDDAMKPAHVLSGGEKTRLALATLVTSRANVLLLDEPTNNLDPASREEILKAIAKYEGAIVLVTHDEGAVEALNPERVLLMPDGDEDLWNDSYLELVAEE